MGENDLVRNVVQAQAMTSIVSTLYKKTTPIETKIQKGFSKI